MVTKFDIDRLAALEGARTGPRRGGVVEVPGGPFLTERSWDAAVAVAVAAAEAAGRIGPFLVVPAPVPEHEWERAVSDAQPERRRREREWLASLKDGRLHDDD